MLDIFLRPAFLAPAIVALAWLLYQLKPSNLPKDLPVLGLREGEWFAMIRAAWRNTMDFKNLQHEMYSKYKDQPILVPLMTETIVVLPASDTQWVVEAPENQLSLHQQAMENLQTDYTVMDPDLVHR